MSQVTKSPKSRKAAAKATVPAPAATLAAQLTAAVATPAAPKAPKASAKRAAPQLTLVITAKGRSFTPRGKSEVSATKDQISWPKLVGLFADDKPHSAAEVLAAIPEHRSYMGYAIKRGWLATA